MKLILFLCYFEEHFNVKSISMQYLVDIVLILEILLGQYIFPISNQFYKKQYLPNVGFEYQLNIEIVYWPNIWSITLLLGQ